MPVHSAILSAHLFSACPLLRLPPTVPCSITLVRPSDLVTCPYHFSFRHFTVARRCSYGPICFVMAIRPSLLDLESDTCARKRSVEISPVEIIRQFFVRVLVMRRDATATRQNLFNKFVMRNVFYRFQTLRSYFKKQQLFNNDKCIFCAYLRKS